MDEHDPHPEVRPGQSEVDADERERNADLRDAELDAREAGIRARESADVDRRRDAQRVLDDAAVRDGHAEVRDSVANERDRAAGLHSFLNDEDLGPGLQARRSAEMDRVDSKSDRSSAADDRTKLSGEGGSDAEDA